MTTHAPGANEENPVDVPDFTGHVTRRRLLGRGAIGAGLAVAGGALLRPDAAGAADGDPVLAGTTVSDLTAETGLSGSATPSMLRLAQASASDDGLVVQLTDSGATGAGVKVSQAGSGPAVSATASGTGSGVFASATTAPAVNAQSNGSAAALFAKNTGSGPGVSVTNTNNGAALLLTSSGTSILASTQFAGTPAGIADKAGISITTQSSTGTYVRTVTGRAIYAESQGANDTFFAVNSGTTGHPRAVTAYLANPSGTGSAIYGSTAGAGAGIEGRSNQGRGGEFIGRVAQVRLLPGTGPHPAVGRTGDLFVDNHGNLWFCKDGSHWKQIA